LRVIKREIFYGFSENVYKPDDDDKSSSGDSDATVATVLRLAWAGGGGTITPSFL